MHMERRLEAYEEASIGMGRGVYRHRKRRLTIRRRGAYVVAKRKCRRSQRRAKGRGLRSTSNRAPNKLSHPLSSRPISDQGSGIRDQ